MEDITKSSEKKLNEGADKLRDGVEKGRKQGIDMVERAFPVADEAIQNAKAKGDAAWEKAKDKGQDLLGTMKAFIQKGPLQATGYAVAAGFLIGVLVSSKIRD